MRVYLASLGCRLNQSEVEMLARRFGQAGHCCVADPRMAHVCVVNSCTVTHVAAGKSRQLIRRLHRTNPQAPIVVTGCYAEMSSEVVGDIEGVELVVGNADKGHLVEAIEGLHFQDADRVCAEPIPAKSEGARKGRTRSLIKIQDGCSNHCAYCIVTLARGQEWSRPPEAVLSDIDEHVAEGYKEIVLTGVNIGAYGRGSDVDLGQLVGLILNNTALPRLRLSSIEPWEMKTEWLSLWDDQRLCRHLHMPLQSGCDATLQRMGRHYSVDEYGDLVDTVRSAIAGVALTTDLIVGFPGETEEEFAQSRDFVRSMAFARLHVFPYSPLPETPAAHFPDRVAHPVKRRRARCLRSIGDEARRSYQEQFIGQVLPVLWEDGQRGSETLSGLTDNYLRVYAAGGGVLRNRITLTYLLRPHGDGLWGRIGSLADSGHVSGAASSRASGGSWDGS